jgi:hypothetical protein
MLLSNVPKLVFDGIKLLLLYEIFSFFRAFFSFWADRKKTRTQTLVTRLHNFMIKPKWFCYDKIQIQSIYLVIYY